MAFWPMPVKWLAAQNGTGARLNTPVMPSVPMGITINLLNIQMVRRLQKNIANNAKRVVLARAIVADYND